MKYNAFKYLDDLKKAGFPAKQAEVMAKGLTEFTESQLATKRDIKELELKIKASQNTQTFQIIGTITALFAIFRFLPDMFQ